MGMNMKRGLVVAGGLLMSLTLIACGSDEESVKADDGMFSGEINSKNRVLIDNETGCQYIQSSNGYGMSVTPRLDKNGKPMCGKTKEDK